MVSSVCTERVVMLTGIPAGILYSLYRRSSSGAIRQTRAVTPKESRFASAITALRYGSCSSSVHEAERETVLSSARTRCMISGLERRWKWAIPIDFAVDSVPAMTINVPSCSKRVKPFSEGGSIALSRSSQKIERLFCFPGESSPSTSLTSVRIACSMSAQSPKLLSL